MPNIQTRNDDDERVTVYVHPMAGQYHADWGAYPYDEFAIDALTAYRADLAKSIGEFATLQKTLTGDDARCIKDLRKDFTRQEKAATIVLNYINPKTTGGNQISGWPIELAHEIDMCFHRYELARG
jgi:hypothetical protein